MEHDPLISVITPVYDTSPEVLAECIESVRAQRYQRWQLCLVDDASPSEHVWPQLSDAMVSDPRIFARRREQNGGIVAASNDAVAMARGEVVVFLDHDDLLHPSALHRVATAFNDHPDLDYVYTDEDLVSLDGRRIAPFYKPDWSPERFRNQMYCCHLSAVRRTLGDRVGWLRPGFDGAQDWDFVLRVTEEARRIVHIPEVLYHWRIVPTSVLAGDDVKPYAYEAAARAVESQCERLGIDAEVIELERQGHFRVKRRVKDEPLVSIIIPTRGSSGAVWGVDRVLVTEAVRSIVEKSTWPNYELIIVADTSTPVGVLADLVDIGGDRIRVIDYPHAFDFSDKCNLGALRARGEHLLFLNDDTEVIDDDWLESLLGLDQEPTAGAVGAELLFEDGRIQHVGHVAIGGNPGHLMFGRSPRADANRLAVWLDREVAGVTAACLMVRAEVFDEVGGFSPEFPGNYNDVDFCHKIRACGYRVVVTPHARLYHFESMTRDPDVATTELAKLRERWGHALHHDPYYNSNYGTDSDGYPEPVLYPPG